MRNISNKHGHFIFTNVENRSSASSTLLHGLDTGAEWKPPQVEFAIFDEI